MAAPRPGEGSAAGRNFWAQPYYSQRAVFASPMSAFFINNNNNNTVVVVVVKAAAGSAATDMLRHCDLVTCNKQSYGRRIAVGS